MVDRSFLGIIVTLLVTATPVQGAPGDVDTMAGGVGAPRPATATAQEPLAVAAAGSSVYVTDYRNVRRIDLGTGIETTIAGNGVSGYAGDGGPATAARFQGAKGVAVDAAGNVFVADENNFRVRRIDAATGIVTSVAGNGTPYTSGDGGPATVAGLNYPKGVAVDGAGNLFITVLNFSVRRVDAVTGIITRVAGNGSGGYSGDGGPATAAQFNYLLDSVAVDAAGNLFIPDSLNARIRRVDAVSGIVTTVAGSGTSGSGGDGGPAVSAELWVPRGVALDGSGNLFIADSANNKIRRVDATTGIITTVAGTGTAGYSGDGGPGTAAALNAPIGVAVDGAGNLAIVDSGNFRVRTLDLGTGILTTFAGNGHLYDGDGGPATGAQISDPGPLAVDATGNLYLTDASNYVVRRVDAVTGTITTAAGNGSFGFSGDGGPATAAQLDLPYGLAVDGAGNLFVADYQNHRVRRIDTASGTITTVAGTGSAGSSGDGGAATAAELHYPLGVAADAAGNLYIAENEGYRVRRVDAATGVITTVAGDGTSGSGGDGGPATAAQLSYPIGLALGGAGNLFITTSDERIRRVDVVTGIISTVAGNGMSGYGGDGGPATAAQLAGAEAVAVDGTGNLFIADSFNARVRRVDATTGIITTVAGSGVFGFAGDGGPATAAEFGPILGVAVDGTGNLFVADPNSRRVRRVATFCGSGGLESGEQCDDGNTTGGDCCSALCQFEPSSNPCTSDGNACTADACDGAGICVHPAGNAGSECRAPAGPCDAAELCDGASTLCPADGFQSAGFPCRPAAGDCDLAESCSGASGFCPVDGFDPTGTPCTDDGDPCTPDQCAGGACVHGDSDGDAVGDLCDNCTVAANPDQGNSDCSDPTFFTSGGCAAPPPSKRGCCDGGDLCDPCPATNNNANCNPGDSTAVVIGSAGGTVSSPDGSVTVIVPSGALATSTTISLTMNGPATEFSLGASVISVSVRPENLQFLLPVTVVFAWLDRDNDGKVDRGTCIGGADAGLSCDRDADCASQNCTSNTNTAELGLVLKRNAQRFSSGGFGASPYQCQNHLGGACTAAVADCSLPATSQVTVANCCDPGMNPDPGMNAWTFQTCHFSELFLGLTAGDLIPGGGSPATDCAAEWSIHNPLNDPYTGAKGLPNTKQACTDGDPVCDADATANGTCLFRVGVCLNIEDPRLLGRDGAVACTPGSAESWTLQKPKPDSAKPIEAANALALRDAVGALGPSSVGGRHGEIVSFSPALTGADLCTAPVQLAVPLASPTKAGKATLSMKTLAASGKDGDKLTLTCLPPP